MELIIQCNFTKHFSNPPFRLLLYLISFPQMGEKKSTFGIDCVNLPLRVCVVLVTVQHTHQQVQLTAENNS